MVQVDPIKPRLKAPVNKHLRLKCDEPLSNVAFNFNLCRYNVVKNQMAGLGAPSPEVAGRLGGMPPKRKFDWDGEIKGDNYFVMQARIVFLCFSMELDIRIINGPEEDGGGIHATFTFLWSIGNVELTYICAQIDIVPFDFSKEAMQAIADDPVAFMLSIYIYVGIEIRPTIINIIMEFIEPALRVVLMAILVPLAVLVWIAQKILEYAIKAIELGRKAVKMAEAALDVAERAANRALNRIAGQYLRYQRMEETANIAGKMTTSECRSSFGRNSNNGCITYNGKERCTWQPSREFKIPAECDKLIAHWKNQAGAWRSQCCSFWTRIKRVFLKVLYTIAKIVVFIILLIPKILLKIMEAILIIAGIVLKLAEMALKIALCIVLAPFNNHKEVLDRNHQLMIPKLITWIWNVKILRINELVVAGMFDEGALTLKARADFVFFGTHMDLGITFSLNFADLLAGLGETIADLMKSIMTLFGGMIECIAAVVISGAKNLMSLGWAEAPQPQLAGDNTTLPNLGMGHGGHVVRELHVDHVVADFAKRHASKLGPRSRLPWVAAGVSAGAAASSPLGQQQRPTHAVLGARPVLADRVDATDYEGYVDDVEDSELGVAIRWEHEAHVTAVAAAAAAQHAGGGGPAAAAAAHALGVALDASGRLRIAPEWAAACIDGDSNANKSNGNTTNGADSSSSDAAAADASDAGLDVEHCGATAYAAAVACTGAQASGGGGGGGGGRGRGGDDSADTIAIPAATRACAAALSSLASRACAAVSVAVRCVAKTADALACSPACGASLIAVSRHCGGFVLRAEHGAHADVASEACSHAVRTAQAGCDASTAADATCISLLEAVPAEEHASVVGPARHRSHHVMITRYK